MEPAPSGSQQASVDPEQPEAISTVARIAAEWPLVGRAEELDYIQNFLGDGLTGDILLSGVAGVGKSRLIREIAVRAEADGWVLERISASEATREIIFGAVSHWIDDAAMNTLRRDERLAQLGRHLHSRARDQRVLLTVDDAHLLDSGTASLLQQYGAGPNLRMVLTVRSGSAAPDSVRAAWAGSRTQRIEVQPLSLDQIDELLSEVLKGNIDRPSRAALWRLCVGNVLLLRELVLAGITSGELVATEGVWHWSPQAPVTASIRELICSRIARLTPTERETIEMVAVGEPLPESLMAGWPNEKDVLSLVRAGLVDLVPDEPGSLLRLEHPLFAEAVRELMPDITAHRARRALAAAILSVPEPPVDGELRAAVWLLDAGIVPDANLLESAAHHAGRLAAYRVQERITRAGRAEYGGYDFSLLLAQALVMQAEWAEVIRLCTSPPLSEADSVGRQCEVAALHAQALAWGCGERTQAMDLLSAVTAGDEKVASIRCFTLGGTIALFSSDLHQAVRTSERVLDAVDHPVEAVISSLITVIPSLALMGNTTAALTWASHGEALLASGVLVPPASRASLVYGHVSALRFAGRYADALERARAFYESSDDASRTASALAAFALGQAQLDVGLLIGAEATLREAVGLFRHEDAAGILPLCRCVLAQVLALSGQADSAFELLGSADREAVVAPVFTPEMARARAWVMAETGELSTGADLARGAARQAMQLGQSAVAARAWHDIARMGEPGSAATALAGLAEIDRGAEPTLFVAHAEALVAQDAPALDRIYERFRRRGALLRAAEVSAVSAALSLAGGHRAPAEQARLRVAECVDSCGGATTPALRRALALDPMSRRESEVAALAARGLTNIQIARRLTVSVRTVEGHLQHVYTKLDIHDRSALPGRCAPASEAVRLQ